MSRPSPNNFYNTVGASGNKSFEDVTLSSSHAYTIEQQLHQKTEEV
jgi:methionine aminopeptidase